MHTQAAQCFMTWPQELADVPPVNLLTSVFYIFQWWWPVLFCYGFIYLSIYFKTAEMLDAHSCLSQPPTGVATSMAGQEERRVKLQETLRGVGMLFKRLHRVYSICSDSGTSAGSQYTPIEVMLLTNMNYF